MPALIDIPTQTFVSREHMLDDQTTNPWFQNRYVFILDDELYGGGPTFHLFRNGVMTTMFKGLNPPQNGLPPGGTPGQILAKQSDQDYDAVWVDNTAPVAESFALLIKPGVRLTIKPGSNLQITS